MKKKIIVALLLFAFISMNIFSTSHMNAKAGTVDSQWYNSNGLGSYSVTIRKNGSTETLGRLTITRESNGAKAVFYNSGTSCKNNGSYTGAKHASNGNATISYVWSGNYQTALYQTLTKPSNAYGKVYMVY